VKEELGSQLESAKNQNKQNFVLIIGFFLAGLVLVTAYLFFIDDIVASLSQPEQISDNKNPESVKKPEKAVPDSKITEPYSSGDDEKLKNQYESKLEEFEATYANKIEDAGNTKWKSNELVKIVEKKNKSLNDYSRKNYLVALEKINGASSLAKTYFKEREEEYTKYFKKANVYFVSRDLQNASDSIIKTIEVKKTDEAERLQKQILRLPEIIDIENSIATLKNAGRYKDEIKELEKILQILPKNSEYKNRLSYLNSQMRTGKLASLLEKTHKAFEDGRYAEAKEILGKAIRIDPQNMDIKNLDQKIQTAELRIKIEKLVDIANKHKADDQWKPRLDALQKASLMDKDNDYLKGELKIAKEIVLIQDEVEKVLAKKDILLKQKSRNRMSQFVSASDRVEELSPSLNRKLMQLENVLKEYSKKLDVMLVSDGKSKVIVRRVGVVGTFKEKTIKLSAGNYVLEASREGYKSKSVSISIDPKNKNNLSFDIRTDERI
tara:strand:- start:3830 stop:5311 length:1482 start_codon:yes stop_codon:yes gene_type:complete